MFKVITSNRVKVTTHAVPPPTASAIDSTPFIIVRSSIPWMSWNGISIMNVNNWSYYSFNALSSVMFAQIDSIAD